MNLLDCMNDYHQFIKHEQGVAAQTAEGYISWLRYFHRWLLANGYPTPTTEVLNTATLRRFLYHLSGDKHYRPRTVRGVFHPIKGMIRFLMTQGILDADPMATILMPKKDAAERLTITDTEIKTLLDACERQRNPKRVALCRAVLHVLIYAGVRRGELLDLKLDDLNFEEGSLLVRCGKGSKSRKVFVPKPCTDALKEWQAFRPDNADGWLFPYDKGRRLHERGLKTLLDELCATAGMRNAANIKPHSIRHWRATDLLRSGADLVAIMSFLGHTNLKTTAIYLHTDEERVRNLANLSNLSTETVKKEGAERSPSDKGRLRRLPR